MRKTAFMGWFLFIGMGGCATQPPKLTDADLAVLCVEKSDWSCALTHYKAVFISNAHSGEVYVAYNTWGKKYYYSMLAAGISFNDAWLAFTGALPNTPIKWEKGERTFATRETTPEERISLSREILRAHAKSVREYNAYNKRQEAEEKQAEAEETRKSIARYSAIGLAIGSKLNAPRRNENTEQRERREKKSNALMAASQSISAQAQADSAKSATACLKEVSVSDRSEARGDRSFKNICGRLVHVYYFHSLDSGKYIVRTQRAEPQTAIMISARLNQGDRAGVEACFSQPRLFNDKDGDQDAECTQ